MAFDMKKFLSEAKTRYSEALESAKAGGFNDIPNGVYIFRWTGAEIRESNKGIPQVVFSHTIQEGDQQGQIKRVYRNLEPGNDDQLSWLLRDFKNLGVDIEKLDIEELPEFFESIENADLDEATFFRGRLSTNKDYQNLQVMTLLSDYSPDAFETEQPEEKPDPKPKKTAASAKPAPTPDPAPKSSKKKEPEPEPETTPSEDDEEGVELQVGMKVKFSKEDKELIGKVVAVNSDETEATIQVGLKKHKVPVEDILDLVDEGLDG